MFQHREVLAIGSDGRCGGEREGRDGQVLGKGGPVY